MRHVAARLLAVVVTAAAFGYVLQIDDSHAAPAPGVTAVQGFGSPEGRPPGRQLYSTHRAVVPFGRTMLELPILLYHYIRVPPSRKQDPIGYGLSVAPESFAAQMDWLAAHGYHAITFQDVRSYWRRASQLPAKPVIITFDDGYQDLYAAAFPILASHGFSAVAYIVSGFVGTAGYVTKDELVQMDRYGIEIAAHTVDHADLARSSQPWMAYQLSQSKAWLEKLVGHAVPDMAYPSGKFNAVTIASVERAGYYSAVTTYLSYDHSQTDRYAWGRVRVSAGESMSDFIKYLGPTMPTVTIT